MRCPRIIDSNWLCLVPFIGLFGCVLLPDDFFTGTGIGKTVGFYSVVGLIPLATAWSYRNNRQPVKYHLIDLLLFAVVLFTFSISYLIHREVNNKMVLLVLLLVLYFSFRIFLVQRSVNLYGLTLAFMLTGLAEAVWGLLQLVGYAASGHRLFRTTGSFLNPGPYAGYLAMVLPVALYYVLRNRRLAAMPWWIALATLVSILLVLPATMSRAAWLAGSTGSLVVLWLYLSKVHQPASQVIRALKRSKARLAGLLAAAALLAATSLAGIYYLKKDSADGRLLIWKISAGFIDWNWFGWGLGYFPGTYGKEQHTYFAAERGTEQEQWVAGAPEYAFNEFLQIAIEMGLFSLILLLAALVCAVVTAIRGRRFAVVGSLAALWVFAGLSYPFSILPFVVMLVFLMAACVSLPYEFDPANDDEYELFDYHVRRRWNGYTIIGMLVLTGIFAAYYVWDRYPVYRAHTDWAQARLYYHAKVYDRVAEQYEPLLPHLKDQPRYLFEYGQSLLKMKKHDESLHVLSYGTEISPDPVFYILMGKNHQQKKLYRHAEECFRHAAQMVPHRLYPYYLLSKLYDEMGDTEKGAAMAAYVVARPAKVDSPAVQEMKTEMRKRLRSDEL